MDLKIVYKNLCPNCGNNISSDRLNEGLPCEICLPKGSKKLKQGPLVKIEERNKKVEEIEELFKKVVKAKMWALQKFWVRRFLEEESFALIAPTGSGKTTVQIILSLYATSFLKKRCLLLLPTSLLVNEVNEKIRKFAEELNLDVTIASYHSMLSTKEKKEQLEKMDSAEIIITTHLSVMKRKEINKQRINIVFVDDVDSFLRRSKAIAYVLKMVDLPERIKKVVEDVFERKIKLKQALIEISKLRETEEIKSQLIVSGATQKAKRTKSIAILNSVFGFSVGLKPEFGRNIADCFVKAENIKESVLNLTKNFGSGCLIFVPMDKGSLFAKELENFLLENGIRVKAFLKPDKRIFEEFKAGNLDALIGIVTTRSPLVRGIDLPARIRYAIFAGVPKFIVRIKIEEFHPTKWLMLLNNIQQAIRDEYKEEYESLVANLIKIKTLRKEELEEIRKALVENRKLSGFLEFVRKVALSGIEFFKKILKDEDVLKAIKESPTISFSEKEGEYSFLIPDSAAYIQASGRTSRLYVGGITKGLSIVIIDEEKAFNSLKKDLSYFEEIEWKSLEEIDKKKIIEEIDEDREKVLLAMQGKLKVEETKIALLTRLFIVESPTKVKTIARFFGKPSRKKYLSLEVNEVFGANSLFIIAASKGHITDLSLKEGLFGVEIKETFIPHFKPIKRCAICGREVEEEEEICVCGSEKFVDAKPRIDALRKIASLVDEVIIATDPDSEGEKIAFDLYLLLKPFNKNIKRAKFHEVTKKEMLRVLEKLEDFDLNLVKAQIVRRIEDRWIGFGISPVLWKVFKNNKLSAGRVQTPVLGWIVERTKKLKEKEELISLKLENGLEISFRAKKGTYKKIVEKNLVEIKEVKVYEDEVNPYPPFTTDTLISALTSLLKINANEAMQIAQKLFENGLITYHRTSSTTVSLTGINLAKEYISSVFGEEFFKGRKWEAEGAHECIRPTKPIDSQKLRNLIGLKLLRFPSPLTEREIRAYDIIFRRFVASQMKASKVEKIKFKIIIGKEEKEFEFLNRVVEEGFSKVFRLQERKIPGLKEGKVKILESRKRIVPAFYPYTYSEIVSTMKEKKIGRPSTYAKILEILKKRNYVKEIKKSTLVSTILGAKVFEFSQSNFSKYLDEETTRKLEEDMDAVESGKKNFEDVLKAVYSEVNEIIRNSIRRGVRYPDLLIENVKT
jgi:reverse gyrase